MFSIEQKRAIADAVQKILRDTNHPELPKGEIVFYLRVEGAADWSWADIKNNGSVETPGFNYHNEYTALASKYPGRGNCHSCRSQRCCPMPRMLAGHRSNIENLGEDYKTAHPDLWEEHAVDTPEEDETGMINWCPMYDEETF